MTELVKHVADLHPVVQDRLQTMRERGRKNALRDSLPSFDVGAYEFEARSDFHAGEKLTLRWLGPRRAVKSVSDYIHKL